MVACRSCIRPIPVSFVSFTWVKFIWLEWSGSAIVIVALIYCDLYVHFATQTRKRLEVAHWTITTWLFYETTVAHRCDTKPIHKLNANPSHHRTGGKKIQGIQHIDRSEHIQSEKHEIELFSNALGLHLIVGGLLWIRNSFVVPKLMHTFFKQFQTVS